MVQFSREFNNSLLIPPNCGQFNTFFVGLYVWNRDVKKTAICKFSDCWIKDQNAIKLKWKKPKEFPLVNPGWGREGKFPRTASEPHGCLPSLPGWALDMSLDTSWCVQGIDNYFQNKGLNLFLKVSAVTQYNIGANIAAKNISSTKYSLFIGCKFVFTYLLKSILNSNTLWKVWYFNDFGVICTKDKNKHNFNCLIPNGRFPGFAKRHDPGNMYSLLKYQWVTP